MVLCFQASARDGLGQPRKSPGLAGRSALVGLMAHGRFSTGEALEGLYPRPALAHGAGRRLLVSSAIVTRTGILAPSLPVRLTNHHAGAADRLRWPEVPKSLRSAPA